MKPVIEIESVSKKFLISANSAGYQTLRESLTSLEFLRKKREFWALRDISFSMDQGETMGIIGNNGAGKTTLLKILSRITKPTSGRGRINGRVASLLEVGTGFHPELTGKENIYLNGVILGLKKKEIDTHFEEIVEFAGVREFLNTPIKHYSTGMWARLAFSVAAHLEPEILLVDEVLSVGDAEFQKKSLSKMNDLSKSGRTVVFVSHNMAAVRQLCSQCILISHGRITDTGSVNDVIGAYMSLHNTDSSGEADLTNLVFRRGTGRVRFSRIELRDSNDQIKSNFLIKEDLHIHLYFSAAEKLRNVRMLIEVYNSSGEIICSMYDSDSGFRLTNVEGTKHISLVMRDIRLYPGKYQISISIISEILNNRYEGYDEIDKVISFDIENQLISDRILSYQEGKVLLLPEWYCHND
jgi:lipopolysaccharide transport system ATP-binding protein